MREAMKSSTTLQKNSKKCYGQSGDVCSAEGGDMNVHILDSVRATST